MFLSRKMGSQLFSLLSKSQSPDNLTLCAKKVSISAQGIPHTLHRSQSRPAGKREDRLSGTTQDAIGQSPVDLSVPSTSDLRTIPKTARFYEEFNVQNFRVAYLPTRRQSFNGKHSADGCACVASEAFEKNAVGAITQEDTNRQSHSVNLSEGRDRSLTKRNALV